MFSPCSPHVALATIFRCAGLRIKKQMQTCMLDKVRRMIMLAKEQLQLLLYGGTALAAIAAAVGIICIVVFILTGRKIKKALERDYGKLDY